MLKVVPREYECSKCGRETYNHYDRCLGCKSDGTVRLKLKCEHKQIVLVYAAGKISELGGSEKDLLIRCPDCDKEVFRMSVDGKEIINLLPL